MQGLKKDPVYSCAAARWAEMKAIAGGVTAIQGSSGAVQRDCAAKFGARNLEYDGEMNSERKLKINFELVSPSFIGQVFDPFLGPLITAGHNYQSAYQRFSEQTGVEDWLEVFHHGPRTVHQGLQFVFGRCFDFSRNPVDELAIGPLKQLIHQTMDSESCRRMIERNISSPKDKSEIKNWEQWRSKKVEAIVLWLFGSATGEKTPGSQSFLSENAQAMIGEEHILPAEDILFSLPWEQRRYAFSFERNTRRKAVKEIEDHRHNLGFMTHLAEGRRDDTFTKREYALAKTFGYVKKGFKVIHAVGFSSQELKEASESEVSVIWSPLSNLLLYGQTLDLRAVKQSGLELSLGSDWSMSGSKNLIDELKIAQQTVVQQGVADQFTAKDLVDMATVNAAKALGLEGSLGKIERGYLADLILVKKKAGVNAYQELIDSASPDLMLTIVNGQPVYGESTWMEKFAPRENAVETMSGACAKMQKSFAHFPDYPSSVTRVGKIQGAFTLAQTETLLTAKITEAGKAVSPAKGQVFRLETLFDCEDAEYSKVIRSFVKEQLPQHLKNRQNLRKKSGLTENWDPTKMRF